MERQFLASVQVWDKKSEGQLCREGPRHPVGQEVVYRLSVRPCSKGVLKHLEMHCTEICQWVKTGEDTSGELCLLLG